MLSPDSRKAALGPRRPSKIFQSDDTEDGSRSAIRTQRLAQHLHALGPRAIHELLIELTTAYGIGVLDRLETYGRIDPRILRAVGGDRFAPALFEVPE